MGQFSHPNVIKLYGVVTVGEPVSLKWVLATTFCSAWLELKQDQYFDEQFFSDLYSPLVDNDMLRALGQQRLKKLPSHHYCQL